MLGVLGQRQCGPRVLRMRSEDFVRRLKIFSRVLVASAFLMWACFYYLTNHYDSTRPTGADEGSGRVYSLNSHGHVVYLTATEEYRIRFLVLAAVSCFVYGFLVDRSLRRLSADSDGGD